jgi:hypothetical protein
MKMTLSRDCLVALVAIMPLLFLGGCIPSYVPPTVVPAPRVGTEVAASFGKTWDAVIDVFSERNIGIKTLDRSSGLIVAENASVRVADGKEWADCGTLPGAAASSLAVASLIAKIARYNILIRGDSTRATVKATVQFSAPGMMTMWAKTDECQTRGVWEKDVEEQISIRAQRK